MKALQIGILAALVLCAGLLVTVYRNQSAHPPAQNAAAPAPAVPAAQPVTPAPEPAAATPQPVAAAEPAAPAKPARVAEAHRRPSPSRGYRKTDDSGNVVRAGGSSTPSAPPQPAPQQSQQASSAPAPAAPEQPKTAAADIPSATAPFKPSEPEPPREPHRVTIPAGTTITVRLAESINSDQRRAGDTFTATLDQPLIVDGFAIAERGAKVTGAILESQQAGRVRGVSAITLHLTRLRTSDGQEVAISTEKFSKQGEKTTGEDAKKVGVGAAIGAAIGAIAGGGKGAAIGAGVGGAAGAGTVMATRGKPVELPVETRLTFKLAEAVTLTEKVK